MSLSNSLSCPSQSLSWAHSLCHPHGGFTGLNSCQSFLKKGSWGWALAVSRRCAGSKTRRRGGLACVGKVRHALAAGSQIRLPNQGPRVMLSPRKARTQHACWYDPLCHPKWTSQADHSTLSCWARRGLGCYQLGQLARELNLFVISALVHVPKSVSHLCLLMVRSETSGILYIQLSLIIITAAVTVNICPSYGPSKILAWNLILTTTGSYLQSCVT